MVEIIESSHLVVECTLIDSMWMADDEQVTRATEERGEVLEELSVRRRGCKGGARAMTAGEAYRGRQATRHR